MIYAIYFFIKTTTKTTTKHTTTKITTKITQLGCIISNHLVCSAVTNLACVAFYIYQLSLNQGIKTTRIWPLGQKKRRLTVWIGANFTYIWHIDWISVTIPRFKLIYQPKYFIEVFLPSQHIIGHFIWWGDIFIMPHGRYETFLCRELFLGFCVKMWKCEIFILLYTQKMQQKIHNKMNTQN